MKRTNKKGFTIVELVVVIAVIAILAAIMIPTFSGVTKDANEAARDKQAQSIYTQYLGNFNYDNGDDPVYNGYIIVDGYYYEVKDGQILNVKAEQSTTSPLENGKCLKEVDEGFYTVGDHNGTAAPAKDCDNCGQKEAVK